MNSYYFPCFLAVCLIVAGCAPQNSAPVVVGQSKSNRIIVSSPKTSLASQLIFPSVPNSEKRTVERNVVQSGHVKSSPEKLVKHQVTATDTAYKIAAKYDTSIDKIIKINKLNSVSDIREGMVLDVVANTREGGSAWEEMKRVLSQPVVRKEDLAQKPVEKEVVSAGLGVEKSVVVEPEVALRNSDKVLNDIEPAAGGVETYTVQPKDTIYRISLKNNVSVIDLMAANDFTEPQDLKAGANIRIPRKGSGGEVRGKQMDTAHISPAAGSAGQESLSAQGQGGDGQPVQVAMLEPSRAVAQEDLESKAVVQQAQREATLTLSKDKPSDKINIAEAEMKRGKVDPVAARAKGLVWPVKGEIIKKFGDDGSGVARTGINIAVPKGTAVLASESGKVLYADDGLKIYGKLVLIRHDNGMVSAYAHNSHLLVKKNEKVKKGQVIALSGSTGNVEQPQLHFELRQHASAIDPMGVLPRL